WLGGNASNALAGSAIRGDGISPKKIARRRRAEKTASRAIVLSPLPFHDSSRVGSCYAGTVPRGAGHATHPVQPFLLHPPPPDPFNGTGLSKRQLGKSAKIALIVRDLDDETTLKMMAADNDDASFFAPFQTRQYRKKSSDSVPGSSERRRVRRRSRLLRPSREPTASKNRLRILPSR